MRKPPPKQVEMFPSEPPAGNRVAGAPAPQPLTTDYRGCALGTAFGSRCTEPCPVCDQGCLVKLHERFVTLIHLHRDRRGRAPIESAFCKVRVADGVVMKGCGKGTELADFDAWLKAFRFSRKGLG